MLTIHTSGTLVKDPQQKISSKGSQYATAPIAVSTKDGDLIINVTSFHEELVTLLASLRKGDGVSVTGQASIGVWTAHDGTTKPSVSVTATRIMAMTDKAAPPKARKQPEQSSPANGPAPVPPPEFDDEIPF